MSRPTSNAEIVHDWFRQRLSGGPIARDTEAYNQLVDALPALIAGLDAATVRADEPEPPAKPRGAKTGADAQS